MKKKLKIIRPDEVKSFFGLIHSIESEFIYGYIQSNLDSQKEKEMVKETTFEEFNISIKPENILVAKELRIENLSVAFPKLMEEETNSYLIVTNLDQCVKSSSHFLKLQKKLHEKNVIFISLDFPLFEDLDTYQKVGKILSIIYDLTSNYQRKQQQTGIEEAKKRGKYQGRKSTITKSIIQKIEKLKEDSLPVSQIAKETGKSRTTIYKILKNDLGYISQPAQLIKIEKEKRKKD